MSNRKKLKGVDLVKLSINNTQAEIADMFDVHPSTVGYCMTQQLKKKETEVKIEIKAVEITPNKNEDELSIYVMPGAWMESKERQRYLNYKQTNGR
jgi:myo-inositol-1-phosphate synthase